MEDEDGSRRTLMAVEPMAMAVADDKTTKRRRRCDQHQQQEEEVDV